MSSSNSASTAELISAYQSMRTDHIITVVIATLLLYDAIVCMDMEVQYVWRAPKASHKLSRLLYIYNRYMSILWNLLDIGLIGSISDTITTYLIQAGYVILLIDPISSILNSRFLLALYETNARLERGGSSASSFSTLDFGEADPRAAGSPELPEFLNSLAGPIHSFPDHDPELFDPKPTTEQQEREGEAGAESGSEVEAQVQADSIEVGEGSERV
ncbi:uncharacterized protein TRAVEDRAFT_49830 [Trametes versicolor FP-101664 SS1]|uniref:uncharacterized protein n=1 Tax=Trametes versicolor (strain FP-101664) TaxID=717944 RepID=UPI0004621C97|nr:uncharacterized protein TRAVEDRAFT_49830 [Trametes versicolor FP-101664 SS1]EIW57019.1 hypothetical protein TRAVEDRAFT_49830 [Trametes versicolor FP-101664 SS1]